MAEESVAGIYDGSWWNQSRSISSSPCLASAVHNHPGNFSSWQLKNYEAEMMRPRSCMEIHDSGPARVSGGVFFGSNSFPMLADSSTMSTILNQVSRDSADEHSIRSMLQEDMDTCQIKDAGLGEEDDSPMNGFKQINQELPHLDQSGSASCTSTADSCQGLPTSTCTTFPIRSDSLTFRCSQMMQNLLGLPEVNGQSISPSSYGMSDYNESSIPPFPRDSSPSLKPSFAFNHTMPYWNSFAAPLDDDIRTSLLASSHSKLVTPTFELPNPDFDTTKFNNEDAQDSISTLKDENLEPAFKRPRIETPSPLPTFKVRKEKLGDRVTALQQLVSPFGKTDTASVLNDAVDYIKFLHEQVNGLITSHMKNGALIQHQQVHHDSLKDGGKPNKQDLRSRGLCLVPVSKTYAVANDIRADHLWASTFAGTFR